MISSRRHLAYAAWLVSSCVALAPFACGSRSDLGAAERADAGPAYDATVVTVHTDAGPDTSDEPLPDANRSDVSDAGASDASTPLDASDADDASDASDQRASCEDAGGYLYCCAKGCSCVLSCSFPPCVEAEWLVPPCDYPGAPDGGACPTLPADAAVSTECAFCGYAPYRGGTAPWCGPSWGPNSVESCRQLEVDGTAERVECRFVSPPCDPIIPPPCGP